MAYHGARHEPRGELPRDLRAPSCQPRFFPAVDLVALRHLPALRRWHRRCGILACCGILLWSLSGSLHPFLSRYQPQPVSFTPPPLSLPAQTLRPLRALLAEQNIDRLNRVRLVSWGGHTYYQVQVADGARRYFDAVAGDENKAGDTAYATALARHYLGDSLVASLERRSAPCIR